MLHDSTNIIYVKSVSLKNNKVERHVPPLHVLVTSDLL